MGRVVDSLPDMAFAHRACWVGPLPWHRAAQRCAASWKEVVSMNVPRMAILCALTLTGWAATLGRPTPIAAQETICLQPQAAKPRVVGRELLILGLSAGASGGTMMELEERKKRDDPVIRNRAMWDWGRAWVEVGLGSALAGLAMGGYRADAACRAQIEGSGWFGAGLGFAMLSGPVAAFETQGWITDAVPWKPILIGGGAALAVIGYQRTRVLTSDTPGAPTLRRPKRHPTHWTPFVTRSRAGRLLLGMTRRF